jgi:hypothetical protein
MTTTIIRSPLFLHRGIYEVRIVGTPQGTISGYFNNEQTLNAATVPYDGKFKAIYVTMNPVKPDLFTRAPNRFIIGAKITTTDAEIIRRVWLLIDVDPLRKANTSSTDAEHQAAFDLAERVRAFLTEQGWPEPLVADSGNGAHLLYKIELPNDAGSTTLLKNLLHVLAQRFDDAIATVDTCVYNAARITKLYGTLACKGPNTADRPHRRSMFLSRPLLEEIGVVPTKLLIALAAQPQPEEKVKAKANTKDGAGTDLRAFIARHKLTVVREKPWDTTGVLFELESCPFNPDHQRKASLMQFSNGAVAFHCVKESCAEHDWKALRAHLVESVLERLRALKVEEVKATWLSFVDDLDAVGIQTLISEVKRLTGIGLNTLKKAVTEHRAEAKRAAMAERLGTRLVIPFYVEDVCQAADRVEAAMVAQITEGECVRFGDSVMRVSVESMPHAHRADSDLPAVPTAQLDLMTQAKLLPLVERVVVVHDDDKPIAVPEKVVEQILVNPHQVPTVSALVTHPLVTKSGRIISDKGIDSDTRLLMYGEVIERLKPYTQAEACAAVKEIDALFLEGFEFATPIDRAVAVAMLLTAVERKLLDQSPGFLVTAAQQSLGKTTLARLVHLVLTGTDAPVFSWPDDEVEVKKLLLSSLLRSPALVVFDNVGDGLVFRSPALAAVMTSAAFQERLLGFNRNAVVSTCVLFVLTGNNVELANDEASRIIPTRLTTTAASPHKRTFKHPDVRHYGLEIRDTILRHLVGIVAGYRQGVERFAPMSRFPMWDAMVRQPLMWAGVEDIGVVFDLNIEASPELGAHLALLIALQKLFPEKKEFSAGGLAEFIRQWGFGELPPVAEALLALRVKDLRSDRSVGHALSRMTGRTVTLKTGEVLALERRTVEGLTRYRVEKR